MKTTFGQRIEVGISIYNDLEGDQTRFDVSNNKNYKLNFYPIKFVSVDGVQAWKLRSDVLSNKNAGLGESIVTVTRVDTATLAEITESFTVEVVSEYDYYYGVLTGTIDKVSTTLQFLIDNKDIEVSAIPD